jgi:predicted transcriptional regulator
MNGQTTTTLDSVLERRVVERTETLVGADMRELLDEIDERITAAEVLRDEIDQASREVRGHLSKLEASRRALLAEKKSRVRTAGSPAERTALQRAGRGNVEKVWRLLKRKPLTKAEITQRLGLNNGTVTWALRALEEQGRVRKTGVRSATGSDQYEHLKAA